MINLFKKKHNPYIKKTENLTAKQLEKVRTVIIKPDYRKDFEKYCVNNKCYILNHFIDGWYDCDRVVSYWIYSNDFDNVNITKIGEMPPIYEFIDKQFVIVDEYQRITYEDLLYYKNVREKLSKGLMDIGKHEREVEKLKDEKRLLEKEIKELDRKMVDRKKELANLGVK